MKSLAQPTFTKNTLQKDLKFCAIEATVEKHSIGKLLNILAIHLELILNSNFFSKQRIKCVSHRIADTGIGVKCLTLTPAIFAQFL